MTNIAAGNTAEIYCPLATSVTFTPGTGGTMRVGVSVRSGDAAIAPQFIQAATTVSVSAGATVFAEAITADATYTTPAGADTALSSLVSGAGTPVYVGAWSGRPAASSVPLGSQIYITDIPAGGRTVFYAGATIWYPEGGEVVLASSGVAKTTLTATTSVTSQTLMTIPGGIIGPNGSLIVEGHYSMTNNANSKTLQFSSSSGNVRLYSAAATSVGQVVFRATMTNRGSEVQQVVQENTFAGAGSAPGSPHIGAENTAVDWVLRNLMQLAVGTDSLTLERWAVVARPF